MTKEEARKRLLDWIQYATDPERVPFMDEPCSDEEIILAMRIGADALFQPSLPSNLDEAAIPESEMAEWMEYGPHTNYPWCTVPDAIKITAEHFFALGKQAGAEWMAGAGETFNGFMSVKGKRSLIAIEGSSQNFKYGENVIVQIRKK